MPCIPYVRLCRFVFALWTLLALPFAAALAQTAAPFLRWPQPAPIAFPTPLSDRQLNAVALTAEPVPVPLAASFNIVGITSAGFRFAGGFDASSWAYAYESLGSSLSWQTYDFPLGPPDAPNAVWGATVPLPPGQFASLLVLGDLVNNAMSPVARFVITYTDGSSSTVTQSMSDWVNARNYPGESLVHCSPSRHNLDGSTDFNSVCVYGYRLPLDPARTASSIALPRDRNMVFLAMLLEPPHVRGSFSYTPGAGSVLLPGTAALNAQFTSADPAFRNASISRMLSVTAPPTPLVPGVRWPAPAPLPYGAPLTSTQLNATAEVATLPIAVPLDAFARVNGIYAEGSEYRERGVDGTGRAYSAEQLGRTLRFAGFDFPLGPLAIPDLASSLTLPLPAVQGRALYLLAAGANGTQRNQPFTITYTDGTSSTIPLDLSAWDDPAAPLAGETLVRSTPYAVTPSAGRQAGTFNVYGYTLPLDGTRTASTLKLPDNTDVVVLALGVGSAAPLPVAGSFVYDPPAGTVLPLGVNPLRVAFSPADTANFAPTRATNAVTVLSPELTVTANNAERLYGAANPAFTGTITGALPGDSFTETFSTDAGSLSPAGTYSIVPAAVGANAALYRQIVRNGVLSVQRAPVSVQVRTQPGVLLEHTTFAWTAAVQSATSGVPSGEVAFVLNGTRIASVALASGSATTTLTLPVGPATLLATYAGDGNFLPGSSGSTSVAVEALDFDLHASAGTQFAATAGSSASLTLRLAPLHGDYAGPVRFSLQGSLPPLAVASFSPAQAMPGTGAQDVVLSIQVPRLTAAAAPPSTWPARAALVALLLPLGLWRLRGRRGRSLLGCLCTLALLAGLAGCGSGYHAADYTLTVVATDGTVEHRVPVTLHLRASAQ